jgi:ADP-ribose pyrophosphatase
MKKIVPADAKLLPEIAKRVFQGVIFDVYQWPQQMFDGTEETFEMLRRPDTVIVVGVQGDDVLTIEDEQPHTGKKLSFPGGRVDDTDADILSAAKREMLEETGFEFNSWNLVKVFQPHFKFEWFIYIFVATDGKRTAEPHLDAGEKISVRQLPYAEVKKLVLDKAGYLAEAHELFAATESAQEIVDLPGFEGREIER